FRRAMDMRRHDQAFIAAPGIAAAEEHQTVKERGERFPRNGPEHNAEQSARAFKVAFPDRVTRIVFEGGMQYARDFRPSLEPARQSECRLLMALKPHHQGAQSAQRKKTVVAARVEAEIVMRVAQAFRMRVPRRHVPDPR